MLNIILLIVNVLVVSNAYPAFKAEIPNSDKIPNPCYPNATTRFWAGVGHEYELGRGARNPFGEDFEKHGKTWTKALCQLDSDGDGVKNGEELGDPDCTWSKNGNPKLLVNITHPGVCTPLTSAKCKTKNSWLKCDTFSCPSLKKTDVSSFPIKFSKTRVPSEPDSYYCVKVRLPEDRSYHIIGTEPIIDNNEVVQDMILYGCESKPDESQGSHDNIQPCFGGLEKCRTVIGAWGVEAPHGQCFSDQFGLPMGTKGYKYAVLQVHWMNREKNSNLYDESGMKLYYTTKLRPHDGQVIRIGQRHINLPPGQSSVSVYGSCTKECTELMPNKTVNIASAIVRMNKLGISGDVKIFSGSSLKKTIVDDHDYTISSPQLISLKEPAILNAGDELRVTCNYRTTDPITSVHWGEGADGEICAGFVTIYPAMENFDKCSQWKELPVCTEVSKDLTYRNCDLETFQKILPLIEDNCNSSCTKLCQVLLQGFVDTKCYDGTVAEFIDEFFVYGKKRPSSYKVTFQLIKNCLGKHPSLKSTAPSLYTFGFFAMVPILSSLQFVLASLIRRP